MENKNETLEKSIDSLIEELFSAEETVEKGMEIPMSGKPEELADEVKSEKAKEEKEGERGRSKEVSDVPSSDEDKSRAKGYEHIQSEQSEEENPEADQSKAMDQTKSKAKPAPAPDMAPFKKSVEISEEAYAEYQEFKKAQIEIEEENELRKAEEEKADLIKSAVFEATSTIREENEELRKALNETQELVKSIARKPVARKSISNVAALEKSFEEEKRQESFSKSEMLDVATDLALNKSVEGFHTNHVIELEDTGYIYDKNARSVLEKELKKRG